MDDVSYEKEPTQDIEISNPMLGKLAAHGARISDLLTLITLVVGSITLALVIRSNDGIAEQRTATAARYADLAKSTREQLMAQRLMTCIIAMPQERRETEYVHTNSFCRRMAEIQ